MGLFGKSRIEREIEELKKQQNERLGGLEPPEPPLKFKEHEQLIDEVMENLNELYKRWKQNRPKLQH